MTSANAGKRQLFKIGGVGHRHVLAGHLEDRRIEPIERARHDFRGHVGADGADRPAFLDDHAARSLLDGFDDRVEVERTERSQIDNFRLDAHPGEFFRRLRRIGHADTE